MIANIPFYQVRKTTNKVLSKRNSRLRSASRRSNSHTNQQAAKNSTGLVEIAGAVGGLNINQEMLDELEDLKYKYAPRKPQKSKAKFDACVKRFQINWIVDARTLDYKDAKF